jgi:hypothetical protein
MLTAGAGSFLRNPLTSIPREIYQSVASRVRGEGTASRLLDLEARGFREVYVGDTYNAIANHPISVFPLMYQGRPWWPLAHRGSLIDVAVEPEGLIARDQATPEAGAAANSRKVNITNAGSPAVVSRVFSGAYNNAIEEYKENR